MAQLKETQLQLQREKEASEAMMVSTGQLGCLGVGCGVCVHVCVRVCVHACVCVRAFVRACVW